ncbi:MAG: hypothetical protein K0Q49_1218 [Haloplasmataceae bacterium]|jgi:hypothetical protein|nr:hypothetical protein [Haloplasmataceae bacterium]
MNKENNTIYNLIKKNTHHVIIIVVIAILSYLASFDNNNKDVSKTFMVWALIYTAFLVLSLVRHKK